MKVYIKRHPHGAGKWIYEGYYNAWQTLGYDVVYYDKLLEIDDADYYLMSLDGDINASRFSGYQSKQKQTFNFFQSKVDSDRIKVLSNARKAFLFIQPWLFPEPWGSHENFVTGVSKQNIDVINSLDNVVKWTFTDTTRYDFYKEWGANIHNIHLGFDSIRYKPVKDDEYKFDVCYVGGWANNGFNEKRKIMIECFKKIKDAGINAGIFINQNISVQDEANLLFNSKVSINIHDRYQHVLGSDTNERTFKSLGLNGFLVSDKVDIVNSIFPDLSLAESPDHMVELIKQNLDKDLTEIKEYNRNLILSEHTYIERVKQLLSL